MNKESTQKKVNQTLTKAALGLLVAMDRQADKYLGKELADIVVFHSRAAAVAALGVAWAPGVGATAAVVVAAGFTWGMYVRINKLINVSLAKNVIKTVAAGVCTNLAASAATTIVVGSALSFIPGLGSLGVTALMAGTAYAITWVSGLVYLNILAVLASKKVDIGKMSTIDLKTLSSQVMSNIDVKGVMKSARDMFSVDKENGALSKEAVASCQPLSENDDMPTPEELVVRDGEGVGMSTDANMDYERLLVLIRRRAKRYHDNDGVIDNYERRELEQLAEKYGVDGLTLEEIIEDVSNDE